MSAPGTINTDNISGSADYIQTISTGANLAAMDADSVRKLWDRAITFGEKNADPYMGLEGNSPSDVIWTETSTSAGRGHTITFTQHAGFSKLGKIGENLFLNPDDYESTIVNSFQVTVDVLRNAYSSTEVMEEAMGLRGELRSKVPMLLGDWLGNRKAEQADMTLLLQADASNVVFAGQKTGFSGLTQSDTIRYEDIELTATELRRFVPPCSIKAGRNGNRVKKYMLMAASESLTDLKLELVDSGIVQHGDVRGSENFAQSGVWIDLLGQCIREREVIDEARPGAIGSPLTPKAYLGAAITAADTAQDIKGNMVSSWADYAQSAPFRWFTDYAYQFVGSGGTYSPGGATANTPGAAPAFVVIYNLTGSDRGKYGVYGFSANSGQVLTMSSRLRAATAGIAATTVGGVTWQAAKHTDAHPVGSLVIPITGSGTVPVPYGFSFMFGSGAMLRAYGKDRNRRDVEQENGNFIERRYITSYFGHKTRYDVANRQLGYKVLVHAVKYAGVNLT